MVAGLRNQSCFAFNHFRKPATIRICMPQWSCIQKNHPMSHDVHGTIDSFRFARKNGEERHAHLHSFPKTRVPIKR
jgi:hypothetical protein